jgi:GH24 family phage-related lysozyme (muramidase)
MNWYKIAKNEKYSSMKWKDFVASVVAFLIPVLSASNYTENDVESLLIKHHNNVQEVKKEIESKPKVSPTNIQKPLSQPTKDVSGDLLSIVKPMLIKHEGNKNFVYRDSKGIPTIGIGFNLTRNDAKLKIQALGLDFKQIMSGQQKLTNEQINTLFNSDVNTAIQDAKKLIRNFDSLPTNVKAVIVDMSFNLGYNKLSGFKKFIAAIESKNFVEAAKQMQQSEWYNQVGNRSRELQGIIINQK